MVYSFDEARRELERRLSEPAPGRIQLLTGPRQVGKTTLLLGLAEALGEAALYSSADEPESSLPGYWERLWAEVERRGRCCVLLDEAPHLSRWDRLLKGEWDRVRRRKSPVHLVVSESSSLRVGAGSRESLAGRFERMTLAHWNAASLARAFPFSESEAARTVVEWGAYPGAVQLLSDPQRWLAYLRDSIVEPALSRDLLALTEIRKPALLRQLFAQCASSPARIVSLQKLQGQLLDAGALETLAHYLSLLEEAYFVAPLQKHAHQRVRRRASPPKLVCLSNSFLRLSHGSGPLPAETWGSWLENACLAHAWNSGQEVAYWREEPLEVDAVLTGTWGRWALEVTAGEVRARALEGLAEFTRRYRDFRPLVICRSEERSAAHRLGMHAQAWQDYLLGGPEPGT
ncbi:MAG: AAA family ATPase [Candidatus Eremiobacterota bacterium]